MKVKTSNCNARGYVQRLVEFKANNLWSEWVEFDHPEARYVVYSYDRHWPLFIYESRTNTWFENTSKYSMTTSKHKSQANPWKDNAIGLHVDDMIKVASDGHIGLIAPLGATA